MCSLDARNEGQWATPHQRETSELGGEKEGGLLISCARATRGRELHSLDARNGRSSRLPSPEDKTSKLGRINLNMHGSCSIRGVKANLGTPLEERGECLPNPVVESRMTNRWAAPPRAERCWIASPTPTVGVCMWEDGARG